MSVSVCAWFVCEYVGWKLGGRRGGGRGEGGKEGRRGMEVRRMEGRHRGREGSR